MKRYLKPLILVLFVALGTTTWAQEADTVRFQNEIERLRDSIRGLNAELDGYRNAPTKIKDFRKEIALLHDSISELYGIMSDQETAIVGLKSKNDELEKTLKKVGPLAQRQLVEMAATLDQKWLDKSFADVSGEALSEELALYEAYKDDDRGVEDAYLRLKSFKDDYTLYVKGVEAINQPYEANTIAELVNQIKGLKDRETHEGRKAELLQLYDQLSLYKYTVMYLQDDIISEIDALLDMYKKDGTEKSAWMQIKMFLDDKDDGQVETYMNRIPWLGVQYQEYLKQLQANPYAPNTVREAIMNLVP